MTPHRAFAEGGERRLDLMSCSPLTFRPVEARRVLWTQCVEECDPTGALISGPARAAASREANDPDDAAFLLRRAGVLTKQLPPVLQQPEIISKSWIARLPHWVPWAAAGAAFLLGWLTNELGPDRQISILSFPLLGLIVWNLAVCAASLWAEWKPRRKPAAISAIPRRPTGTDPIASARAEFNTRAAAWEAPHHHARLKWAFHAAAIALALGIVAGMYVRGLAKQYTVTWESTFLAPQQVRTITRIVLGPASLITGIPVPDPPDRNAAPKSAAPWIHLWAASAFLFIVIPRLLLANMARQQAAKAQPDYRAEFESWLAVCRSIASGHTQAADILPVHFEPEPRVRDSLRLILQHLWGTHVSADFHSAISYGAEETAASLTPAPQYLALIFPLSSTPESEVHGTLISAFAAAGPERGRRLMVLDASSFEARFRTLPEYPQRLAARRAAWEKVAAGAFRILLLDDAARRDPAAAARAVLTAT